MEGPDLGKEEDSMKIVSYVVVSILFTFLMISTANAEPDDMAAAQHRRFQDETYIQGERIIPPSAGVSWKERVMMQREIKKRAQAMRNTLMREATIERQKESRNAMRQAPVQVESPMQ
jgi:hypothetical protein